MNAENKFAARVLDARRCAAMARTRGLKFDVSDYINQALKDLWRTRSPDEAKRITERWVVWDADGRPWPRLPPPENVIRFYRIGSTAQAATVNHPMTPLQIISDWFEKQDAEMQGEIAAMAALLVFEGAELLDFDTQGRVEYFQRWLNEVGLPAHTVVGRALTFRTCFEYFAESMFTESAWKRSEKASRKVLEEAKRDPNSKAARLAPTARRLLDTLPARKSKWIRIGKSWRELADAHLKPGALTVWRISQYE
ncbi:hypothetical protein [Bradyrhizobium japonicum]|uniref:hypothetical protein n=1 Tax=Bradyrhizobium japonicum TaxID=375 RepID=UPI001E5F97B3|nr:hypothetical protein [Bradyrhizobium japonicum]MCD9825459.1 hypothetical protein [Bradyrhizobium japonicum]MCD9898410.1 hypothetical protein [Bradyrhizobium japonicum]MEB2671189.1 hypothetical protein [Bradyrhizobium japonicum]WLB28575.1 hypothetical protein QIH85_43510 [Bradyrhizobium japonicum]WRI90508.1 hypothetical protein R3F75_06055 [Bradyrhizobium japonicum]